MTGGIDNRPPAIALMGPTASGKTDLAIALAGRFPLGLVSADSALVYRGLDIGSAKPDAGTLAVHPHELVDIREPDQPFSAGDFRTEALAAMARIHAAGKVPLLVGGTGLYFRALTRGLAELPVAQPALRQALSARGGREGWPALHAELARLDPVAATRIRPTDPQRIQRALEVCLSTGQPLSVLQAQSSQRPPWRLLKLVLLPADRAQLHRRIARRFDIMLAAGFLDEVRRLRADPRLAGRPDLPALRAVGYRQAWSHLDGQTDTDGFRQQAIEATRQLAKRQLTWFRGERDAFALDPLAADPLPAAVRYVEAFLGDRSE
ncbi:tRNA (adenosine(37)-N6)-dimethylallyltransferase MiaA [Pseudofulvimonas gallinarii]|uniref:tRNA dimethylallyltransferase n=1 Tax=Pseudofulvimonas gallinarii TaxID=634155 RepID=A0A4R3LKK0_9GAMM|nr:tRNA (adenosine(37)-N6)-dimethylallyltransferase MiaA [Pseudofulvimonas gallinarii]TCT00840.1 tRNA dimethylallyltransferase [Pseudofulvimonas gallinarii]THD12868.1 tRNA (adenosine(37)-N6)-dimethylallyltransferase MiaA [Pseudofulvimonas gallinarii]